MSLQIIWNSIVDEKTDVLVTPASRFPRIGRGLDSVVHEAAGPGLLKARQKLGEIGPGIVGETPAYGLAKRIGAKHVLHALGPIYETGERNEAFVLDACYLRILLKAESLGARVVSLPVLSSGRFGFPMEQAMDTAVGAVVTFLRTHRKMTVKLVVIDGAFYDYALKRWPQWCCKRFTREREAAYRIAHPVVTQAEALQSEDGLREDEPLDYFRGVKLRLDGAEKSFCAHFRRLWKGVKERECRAFAEATRGRGPASALVYLRTNEDLAVRTGISGSSIKHFCSTEKEIRPSRDKVIALAVAMRLEPACARGLLASAGYRLGETVRDVIVRTAVSRRDGDVARLNGELSAAGEERLNVKEER